MTYVEARAALQLIAEQEIGTRLRQAADHEQRQFDRSLDALRREQVERI
jgi:hypothetical protein